MNRMPLTPLDIIQKQFQPGRKGFDADEVRQFLDQVRESMEELLKENQRLREHVARRESELATLRDQESDIKETLLLARRMSEELGRTARREADVVVGEARIEADRILQSALDERGRIQAELVELRAHRIRLVAEVRAVVDAHAGLLAQYEQGAAH